MTIAELARRLRESRDPLADAAISGPTPIPDDLVALTLVPVEVFGGDCDCHIKAGHAYEQPAGTPKGMTAQEQPGGLIKLVPRCHGWGYGLMDAVQSWSDCNRAGGQIYRVDDCDPQYREPGETVTIYVPRDSLDWFKRRFGEDYATAETRAP